MKKFTILCINLLLHLQQIVFAGDQSQYACARYELSSLPRESRLHIWMQPLLIDASIIDQHVNSENDIPAELACDISESENGQLITETTTNKHDLSHIEQTVRTLIISKKVATKFSMTMSNKFDALACDDGLDLDNEEIVYDVCNDDVAMDSLTSSESTSPESLLDNKSAVASNLKSNSKKKYKKIKAKKQIIQVQELSKEDKIKFIVNQIEQDLGTTDSDQILAQFTTPTLILRSLNGMRAEIKNPRPMRYWNLQGTPLLLKVIQDHARQTGYATLGMSEALRSFKQEAVKHLLHIKNHKKDRNLLGFNTIKESDFLQKNIDAADEMKIIMQACKVLHTDSNL